MRPRRESRPKPGRPRHGLFSLNAYVDFLLPVPAVLMEDGSVYLVDPLVEAIW